MIKVPGVDNIILNQVQAQTIKPVVQETKKSRIARDKEREGQKHSDGERMARSVKKLNQAVEVLDSTLEFRLVERDGRWMVQIIDRPANRLIQEVTPERVIDAVNKLQRVLGLIVDELI